MVEYYHHMVEVGCSIQTRAYHSPDMAGESVLPPGDKLKVRGGPLQPQYQLCHDVALNFV